ncbi:MAG: hypothetical protein V3V99_01000 [candidate division Zixibacteria bacterium]
MRSRLLFLAILAVSLLLAIPSFAQTEEELVNKFLKKAEKNQIKKVGYLIIQGSYGRLNSDNDYNYFTGRVSPLMATATGGPVSIDGIYRSKEFYLGFGILTSPKSSAQVGLTYWLKMGSKEVGNYDLTSLNLEDTDVRTDFDLSSQIQVYGLSGSFDYYLFNRPDKFGILEKAAIKVGGGSGIYFAKWDLWDGYSGFNLNTQTATTIEGNLTGMAPGFSAHVSAEYPIKMGGLILEGSLKYLYLNFAKMKWYNGNNEETVATYNLSGDRVDLNLSGPRAQFGLKRYFCW